MFRHSTVFMLVFATVVVRSSTKTLAKPLQLEASSSNLTHSKRYSTNEEIEGLDLSQPTLSTEKNFYTENIIFYSAASHDDTKYVTPNRSTSPLTFVVTETYEMGITVSLSQESNYSMYHLPSNDSYENEFFQTTTNPPIHLSNKCYNETELFFRRVHFFNATTSKLLALFSFHYANLNNVFNKTVDAEKTYLNHPGECATSLEISQRNFQIIENSTVYLQDCNLNNLTHTTDVLKEHLLKFQLMCWVYNETMHMLISWGNIYEHMLNEVNVTLQTRVVYTYTVRSILKYYDELINFKIKFDDTKRNIFYSIYENKLTTLMNEPILLNLVGDSINRITVSLGKWKTFFENKLRDDGNIFYTIRLPLYVITLVIGTMGNGILCVIFALESGVRNSANVLIFNLAVSDSLNLITNIVPHLILEFNASLLEPFFNYGDNFCIVLLTFNFLCIGLSAWTVVALGVQKYSIIRSSKQGLGKMHCIPNIYMAFAYVIVVWVIAISLCLPISLEASVYTSGLCAHGARLDLLMLLGYGIVPFAIVAVFYILSAREMAVSARTIPGESQGVSVQRKARLKGAKVLVALTVCFSVSYIPYFLTSCLSYWELLPEHIGFQYLQAIFFLLLFINPAANPIALYISSTTYRKYFKKYLFGYCAKKKPPALDFPNAIEMNRVVQ